MKKFLLVSSFVFFLTACNNTTYPKDAIVKTYYWEDITEDDIEYMKSEEGVYDVTINEDGSVNYIVSSNYLEEARLIYKSEIEYLVENLESYGITFVNSINMNEDLTNFEIYILDDEINIDEAFLIEDLMMYGYVYYEYFGESTEIPEISVTVYNSNNEVVENFIYSNFYENLESFLTEEELEVFHSFHTEDSHEHTHEH